MEELTAALAGSFQVTTAPNSINAAHPRFSQFKSGGNVATQDDRRCRYLQLQKQKRFDATSLVRRLAEDIWDEPDDEVEDEGTHGCEEEEGDGSMDVEVIRTKPGRFYCDQLMLSEWMLEVPEMFAEDWVMVPTPVGKRCLVISSRGQTKAYARNGYKVNSFPSLLPGGNRHQSQWKNETTILDCIYCQLTKKFYILDMMCWRHQPLYDCEAEFRFYWLQTKLDEVPGIGLTSKLNPYTFEVLPNSACSSETIRGRMSGYANASYQLDGLLFYHKHATYTFGTTPLVVWLKPYMLPEILSVSVPDNFLRDAPGSYHNFDTHVERVKRELVEKAERRLNSQTEGSRDVSRRKHRTENRNKNEREMEGVEGVMGSNDAEFGRVDVVDALDRSVASTTSAGEKGGELSPASSSTTMFDGANCTFLFVAPGENGCNI